MSGFLLSPLLSFLLVPPVAIAQTTENQSSLAREIQYYYGARTIVDLKLGQLLEQYPELQGLQPASSQDPLGPALERVGGNVKAFFQNLPNTTSIEEVHQERLSSSGKVTEDGLQKFHYLVLRDTEKNASELKEYRTDARGRPIKPHVLPSGPTLITQGFTASSAYFDPAYQSGSDFRYLGTADLDGHQTCVVAFAQRPETAGILSRLELQSGPIRSAVVLVQGIAWIDQRSFQIVQLITNLLKSRDDLGLNRESTQIRFAPVHFTKASTDFWLPIEVVVTLEWQGETYRNKHRYSKYRLFSVQTEEHPKEGTPTAAVTEGEKEPQGETHPAEQVDQARRAPGTHPAVRSEPVTALPPPPGPSPGPPSSTIKVEVRQVLVPVIVTDRKGHYITDLKVSDFQLLEDGVPQQALSLYTEQGAARVFEPVPPDLRQPPRTTLGITSPAGPLGASTYVVCVDTLNSSFENFSHVRSALRKLFESEKPADAAYGLIVLGRTTSTIQDLTKDPATVLAAIGTKKLDKAILQNNTASLRQQVSYLTEMLQGYCQRCPCLTGQAPLVGGDRTCTGLWQKVEGWAALAAQERTMLVTQFLRELRAVVMQMGTIPGRRVFILISDGFNLQPGRELFRLMGAYTGDPGVVLREPAPYLSPEFDSVVRAASSNNVTFYTLDSRGLFASPNATYDAGGDYHPTRATAAVMPEMLQQAETQAIENQGVLQHLAEATGGLFYRNSNDLLKGMRQALADGRVYYVLAYISKNQSADGKFRSIQVQVKGKQLAVRAKQGYWAPRPPG
jgi:VWFA-related protein